MIEAARLVGFGLGFLVLFGALGSGPTLALARNLPARLVLSPIIGFALAASVLSVVALIMPMKIAAWVLLLPGTVASVVLAIWVGRQKLLSDLREAAAPVSLVIVGFVFAFIPGILHGTVGPTSQLLSDAWLYISVDTWLRDHTLLSGAPPAEAAQYDLVPSYGHTITSFFSGIGLSVVNGAVSIIFRVGPDETHLAFLGTLYALLPASIWFAARMLGVGRFPAAVGAFFGLSPATLYLIGDSQLGNLSALLLAPAVLILGTRSILHGSFGEIFLTAILTSGLVAVYPTYLPPLFLTGALATVSLVLYRIIRHGVQLPWLLALGRRVALLAVGVVLVSLETSIRAVKWFQLINSEPWAAFPERFLTLKNFGSWAFGLLHLFELQWFDLLSRPQMILAMALPVLLAVLILWGVIRNEAQGALFVLGPVGVSLALAFYSDSTYQDGCSYCFWKACNFMLPFLGLGIALGLQRLIPRLLRSGGGTRAVAIGMAFVVFLSVAGVVRANAKLAIVQYLSPQIVSTNLREIADEVDKLPKPATILLEGADASAARPNYGVTSSYHLIRGEDTKISLDLTRDSSNILTGPKQDIESGAYYTPDYSHVVTRFPGVQSDRTLIAQRGAYALFRRAPIDVAIVRTGWAWDPSEDREAIPWVANPFELWISSEQSGPVTLTIGLNEAQQSLDPYDPTPLSFQLEGKEIELNRSADGSELCIELPLKEGRTVLSVIPQLDPQVIRKAANPPGRWLLNGGTPLPPPPKALGLSSVEAQPGQCSAKFSSISTASFGEEPTREPPAGVTLTADPNPVSTRTGTTTVAWNTGDGSVGKVWLAIDGGPETLFAQGPKGEKEVNWILAGRRYEFRLYAGADRTSPLASVTVKASGAE